ncbi:MAG: hypothetical protein H7A23_12975 [Leptospiraceae bacterium]|nr:hypothetical protein [Leptospiraceae bacterium]MCP5495463.1 hypothetical protein [Leptospiraceae bacterium]
MEKDLKLIGIENHNSRRRKKGLEPLTKKEFRKYTRNVSKDATGRNAPHVDKAIERMKETFGKDVTRKKKECFRCGKNKKLTEFVCRYDGKEPVINNVCKQCESKRTSEWAKSRKSR